MTIASTTMGISPTITPLQAVDNAHYFALWHILQDCAAPGQIAAATVKTVRAAVMFKKAFAASTPLPADLLAAIQGRAAS